MKKNVLILGSGGREHALAWKFSQSSLLANLYCIPGNPGISTLASCPTGISEDAEALTRFIHDNKIDIFVCGPEAPLAEGLMDKLRQKLSDDVILIGPGKQGATLESSKQFAKEFMMRYNIPTAAYRSFNSQSLNQATEFIMTMNTPVVLKADGLAAGKGVVICNTRQEAVQEVTDMLNGKFGEASKVVVVEEFLSGIECSVFVLTNGEQYIVLPEAKDYKRVGEADAGPNTGGMGSVSPVPFFTDELRKRICSSIIEPTLSGLKAEKIEYQGFVFFGLIIVNGDPFVIEYNCRLGDPETESIMLRIESDFIEMMTACHDRRLDNYKIKISPQSAATVFLVSGGYPGAFARGKMITLPSMNSNSVLFHAGTAFSEGNLVTTGGRVIAVSSLAEGLSEALSSSNRLADEIKFDGKYFRRDIGFDLHI
ncbi:MAG: phosphoribosylamine--glycine ligase [Saprospiraceae bacterium]